MVVCGCSMRMTRTLYEKGSVVQLGNISNLVALLLICVLLYVVSQSPRFVWGNFST